MTELDNQITSPAELVALIDDRWARWSHAIDQLSPEQLESPGTSGQWSARDLLGHIATWDQVAIDRVQSILRHEPRPKLDVPIDDYNGRAVAAQQDLSPQALRELMDQTHTNLLASLEAASTASTEQIAKIVKDTPGDTWEHYDEHRAQVVERFGGPAM